MSSQRLRNWKCSGTRPKRSCQEYHENVKKNLFRVQLQFLSVTCPSGWEDSKLTCSDGNLCMPEWTTWNYTNIYIEIWTCPSGQVWCKLAQDLNQLETDKRANVENIGCTCYDILQCADFNSANLQDVYKYNNRNQLFSRCDTTLV